MLVMLGSLPTLPKRFAGTNSIHPTLPSSSSEPLNLSIPPTPPITPSTRLEDGIIMSIADPGIRSTLQFWFTTGIIILHQVIKAAIECAPEIRNMIVDLVANDN